MRTYNTSEIQSLLETLALGEEVLLDLKEADNALRWRIVNTRQGFQSFVDVTAEEISHFEFLISTPRGSQLLARAMVEAQLVPLLSHPDTRIACVGVGLEGANELPKDWQRALTSNDVVLSWIDGPTEHRGVHLNLVEASVDIRLIDGEPHVWVREEQREGEKITVVEHYAEGRQAHLIARLKKRRLDTEPTTGQFTAVETWMTGRPEHFSRVEVRRKWVSQETG